MGHVAKACPEVHVVVVLCAYVALNLQSLWLACNVHIRQIMDMHARRMSKRVWCFL